MAVMLFVAGLNTFLLSGIIGAAIGIAILLVVASIGGILGRMNRWP